MGTCHVPPPPGSPALTLEFSFSRFSLPFRAHAGVTVLSAFWFSALCVVEPRGQRDGHASLPHQVLTHSLTHARAHDCRFPSAEAALPLCSGSLGSLLSETRRGLRSWGVGGGDEVKTTATLQTPAFFFSPAPSFLQQKRMTQSDLLGPLKRGPPHSRGGLSLAEPVYSSRGAGGCVCTYVYICT